DIYHNHKHKPLQCDYCDKEFFNNISYRNHMKTHVPDVQVESFVCSVCGLITKYLDILKDHVEQDKDAPCFSAIILKETLTLGYTCENCSLDFYSIKHLKQHRLSSIHSDKFFYCVICRHEFTTLRHMRSHATKSQGIRRMARNISHHRGILYVHSEVSYRCEFCNFVTNYPKSLEIHLDKHYDQLKFKSTICTKSFGRKQLLVQHINRHQGKKRYKCQDYFGQSDCDAAFITYNLLKNHIQKEHKNPSNEQKPAKRKRVSKSYLNVIELENDDNIEYIDEDGVVDNSSKNNNDARTDNDSFEIIVANEISVDADDNEYVIQYKDDVNAYSE
ncbi:hypothetical protein DOY81_010900, partial [Sarcophaga bullata]